MNHARFRLATQVVLFVFSTLTLHSQVLAKGYIAGRVTSVEGNGLAGVSVIARHSDVDLEESTLTDMVGSYRLRIDFPGEVEVTARRLGFKQEKRTGVRVSEGGSTTSLSFVLKTETDERSVIEQLPYSSFISLLPDGWAKREAFSLDWELAFPSAVLEQPSLEKLTAQLSLGVQGRARRGRPQESYIRPEAAARWLAKYMPLGKQLKNFHLPALSTPDTAGAQITEFFMPPDDVSHDLYVSSDGIVWADQQASGLWRLDPKTGKGRTVPGPFGPKDILSPERTVMYRNVLAAKDGVHLWVVAFVGKIVAFDPKTEKWGKVFDLAKEFGFFGPHTLKEDAEGNLWVSDYYAQYPGRGAKIELNTGKMTLINYPPLELPFERKATDGYGLCVCPDGRVWTTLLGVGTFVEIAPRTLEARARELPDIIGGPRRLDCGPDGILWIPAFATGVLFRFDPKTEEFGRFAIPTPDSGPYTVKVHPKTGEVWIVTYFSDQVYRFNPRTAKFSVYQLPNRLTWPRDIQFRADSEVWMVHTGRTRQSLIRIQYSDQGLPSAAGPQ